MTSPRRRPRPLPPLPARGLPPRGDPRRPVFLAIRSMRLLCVLLFLFAAFMTWQTFRGGYSQHISMSLLLGRIGIYAIPATCYLVCIFGLLERRLWSIIVALVVAALHWLLVDAILALLILRAVRGSVAMSEPVVFVPVVVAFAWALAIGQLLWHLALSVKGIRFDMAGHDDGAPTGFEVIPKDQT